MKSQAATTFMLFLITELVLAALGGAVVYKTVKDVNTMFEERFLSRDMALLLDALGPYPVSAIYGFYTYDAQPILDAYKTKGLAIARDKPLLLKPAIYLSVWGTYGVAQLSAPVATFLSQPTPILDQFTITIAEKVTAKHVNNRAGESYPRIIDERASYDAQFDRAGALHVSYIPGDLHLAPLGESLAWNPRHLSCPPKSAADSFAYDTPDDVAFFTSGLLVTPGIRGRMHDRQLNTGEPILSLRTGESITLHYTQDKYATACRLYNSITGFTADPVTLLPLLEGGIRKQPSSTIAFSAPLSFYQETEAYHAFVKALT